MRAIIIDDEKMAIELFTKILKDFDDIDLVGSFTNGDDALEILDELNPDVVFLDIEMDKVSGLEYAQLILSKKDDVEIVFVTAYSQYAIDAFELNVTDYLLKPLRADRLRKTLDRLKLRNAEEVVEEKQDKMLTIKSFGSFEVVDSYSNSVKWRTQKGKELFAYLWHHGSSSVHKAVILEEVFYDKDLEKATTLMHTTIYQLRKGLRDFGLEKPIIYSNEAYQLNFQWKSDLDEFRELVNSDDRNDDSALRIMELYGGDYMAMEAYHWAMEAQTRKQEIFVDYLQECSQAKTQAGQYDMTLKQCLDRLYQEDPFNEKVVGDLMEYYVSSGNKARLVLFFDQYKKECTENWGVSPSEEIVDLYASYIRA